MKVAEKLFALLIPNAGVDQYLPVVLFNEEAAHGPVAQVVFIRRIVPLPEYLWHHPEHGPAVEFEISCMDRM